MYILDFMKKIQNGYIITKFHNFHKNNRECIAVLSILISGLCVFIHYD